MAVRRDDLQISPILGDSYGSVVSDQSTQIGLYLELRGVAVAAATCTCTLRREATTVVLTPSIATTGEVTATVAAANLTTLAATMLTGFVAYWEGTVTDGAVTHQWRFEQPLIVTDRLFRFALLYAQLRTRIPQLANAATIPSGQTNLHPQVREALEELRYEIEDMIGGMHGDVGLWAAMNPAQLKSLAVYWVVAWLYRYMAAADNGQSHLALEAARNEKLFAERRVHVVASMKRDTVAYSADGARRDLVRVDNDPRARKPGDWYYGGAL